MTPITVAAATDNNGLALSYSVTSGMPAGLSFNTSTLQFTGTPTTSGAYSIILKAADSKSSTSDTFTLSVSATGTRVFETASTTAGFFAFSGLSSADQMCMADANFPKDGRTYVALLSDSSVNAKTRFTLTYPVVSATATPYIVTSSNFFYPPGNTVQWSKPINATGALAWTGSNTDGTYDSAGGACANWLSTTTTGEAGDPTSITGKGITNSSASCNVARPLICVSTTP